MTSELLDILRENIVQITFTKVDGTERVLLGSLMEKYLPVRENKESTIKRSNNITSVWDVENQGYRSFRNDSVISYKVMEKEYV